jgi:hypothetical protein
MIFAHPLPEVIVFTETGRHLSMLNARIILLASSQTPDENTKSILLRKKGIILAAMLKQKCILT